MTYEKFKALSTALEEEFGEVLFDGKKTISVKVYIFRCSGIWITILNKEEGESWSTCIDLKDACGRLWERQWGALEGQKQDLEDFNGTFLCV